MYMNIKSGFPLLSTRWVEAAWFGLGLSLCVRPIRIIYMCLHHLLPHFTSLASPISRRLLFQFVLSTYTRLVHTGYPSISTLRSGAAWLGRARRPADKVHATGTSIYLPRLSRLQVQGRQNN